MTELPGSESADPRGVVSDEPVFVVTDQGVSTGIGTYAIALFQLLRASFPGLRVASLGYLNSDAGDEIWRPPGTRLAQSPVDVPFAQMRNLNALATSLPASSKMHFCGVDYRGVTRFDRVVVTLHDYYLRTPSTNSFGRPLDLARDLSAAFNFLTVPRRIRTADTVLVPTEFVRRCLWEGASIRSEVVHHWIDSARFVVRAQREARRSLGLPNDKKLLLNVSAGSSNKNPALLKSIVARLNPGYMLVKVGARIGGPSSRVLEIPRLKSDAYPLLFNACDAYLHTSSIEGFGRPLIEALGSELPVVSLDSEVSREVLGPAGTFVAPHESPGLWIEAITQLEEQPFRDGIVSQIRKRKPSFDATVARQRLTQIYRQAFLR